MVSFFTKQSLQNILLVTLLNKKSIFIILFGFYLLQAQVQIGGNGGFPVIGKEWKKISTPEQDVYYPAEFEEMAQRITWYLEYIRDNSYESLGHTNRGSGKHKRNLPIILNNYSFVPNGIVTFSPMMSIWWNNFNGGDVNWYRNITAHEGRHMGQLQIDRKFNNFDFRLFIDSPSFDLLLFATPFWVHEGDAVISETIFTDGGRGRDPDFDAHFRALVLKDTKKAKNYFKAVMGFDEGKSRKLDLYVYGYHIAAYLHRKYGEDIIGKMLRDINASTLTIPNLWMVVEHYTKMNLQQLYGKVVDDLYKVWTEQQSKLNITSVTQISPKQKYNRHIDYRVVGVDNDGTVYALKKDIQVQVPDLVAIKDNKTSQFMSLPVLIDFYFNTGTDFLSINGNKLSVILGIEDIGRKGQMRGKNIVRVIDLKTRQQQDIEGNSSYYSASASPDGEKILLAHLAKDNNSILSVYNLKTKKVIKEFKMGIENQIFNISWIDNESVVFGNIRSKKNDNVVMQMNTVSGNTKVLFNSKKGDFALQSKVFNNTLFFVSAYSGRNNIYAINLSNQKRYRVTSRPHSISRFTVTKDEIIFDDLTTQGNNIVKIKNDPSKWQPIESVTKVKAFLYEDLVKSAGGVNLSKIPFRSKDYPSKNYNWLLNPRYHHLFTFLIPGNNLSKDGGSSIEFGASWQIRDIFDTTYLKFSGAYGTAGTYNMGASLTYAAFYPIFSAGVHYYNRSEELYNFIYSGSVNMPLDFASLSFYFRNDLKFSILGIHYVDRKRVNPVVTYGNSIGDYNIFSFYSSVSYGIPNEDVSHISGESGLTFFLDRILYTHKISFFGKAEYQLDKKTVRYESFTTTSLLGAGSSYTSWLTTETFTDERFLGLAAARYGLRLFEINLPIINSFYFRSVFTEFIYQSLFTSKAQFSRFGANTYFKVGIYPGIDLKVGYTIFYDPKTQGTEGSVYLGM